MTTIELGIIFVVFLVGLFIGANAFSKLSSRQVVAREDPTELLTRSIAAIASLQKLFNIAESHPKQDKKKKSSKKKR